MFGDSCNVTFHCFKQSGWIKKSLHNKFPLTEEGGDYKAPFADYMIPLFGDGPLSGIVALIIGVLIALGLGYIAALILKRRNPPEASK